MDQSRVAVEQTTGEPEGLETGVGVGEDVAEFAIVESLRDLSGYGVHHEANTTDLIGNESVRGAAFDDVVGHVRTGAVDEATDDVARSVELRDGAESILIQEALHQRPVDGFADATVL